MAILKKFDPGFIKKLINIYAIIKLVFPTVESPIVTNLIINIFFTSAIKNPK
jgi:hypothetical protein